jgi:PAS domain S-box-containing protein
MKQNHNIENMSDDPTIRELQATIRHLETRLSTYEGTADALCSSRQKYAALIETLPHGVEECTVEGIITFSNRAYHRMCGYADGELIGKSIWDLTADPDERVALPGVLMHLAATRPPPRPYMTQKLARDGRRIDV